MRTLLAYLISPLVAPIILSILSYRDGINGMWQMLFVSCFMAYPISWVVGTIGFLTLRKLKKESVKHYFCTGAGAGALVLIVMAFDEEMKPEALIVVGLYTLLGSLVTTTFILIRGPQESIQSR